MILAAKIQALLDGRYNVATDDLSELAPDVLRHRLVLNFEAQAEGTDADEVISEVILQADDETRAEAAAA
jgi:MoxR-like ATPase